MLLIQMQIYFQIPNDFLSGVNTNGFFKKIIVSCFRRVNELSLIH